MIQWFWQISHFILAGKNTNINITDDKAGVWKVIETFLLSGDMADQFNWYTE